MHQVLSHTIHHFISSIFRFFVLFSFICDLASIALLMLRSKKDKALRRQQLLDYIAPQLISTCVEHTDELLRSDYGHDVLYEVLNEASGNHFVFLHILTALRL